MYNANVQTTNNWYEAWQKWSRSVNLIPNKCADEENIFKTARSSAQPAKWLGDLNDQKLFLICICLAPTIIPLGGQNFKL